ncbi:MAG TPA: hypothetical protein VFB59_03480 [Candidatus Saccharimonadales bacterium]|nr:hypothetical protein [Candidatus Saccharimonadales bacterium]
MTLAFSAEQMQKLDPRQKMLANLCWILHDTTVAIVDEKGYEPVVTPGRVSHELPTKQSLDSSLYLDEENYSIRSGSWTTANYDLSFADKMLDMLPGFKDWSPEASQKPNHISMALGIRWPRLAVGQENILRLNSNGEATLDFPRSLVRRITPTHLLVGVTAFGATLRQGAAQLGLQTPEIPYTEIGEVLGDFRNAKEALRGAEDSHFVIPEELKAAVPEL